MTEADAGRLARRIRHFLSTDPGGSFVAEDGGEVVGLSQSFVRDGLLDAVAAWPPSRTTRVGGSGGACSNGPSATDRPRARDHPVVPGPLGDGAVLVGRVRAAPGGRR